MSYDMFTSTYYGQSKQSHPHGGTPDWIIDKLAAKYNISLFDPCPNNPTFDGLKIDWPRGHPIFVNPPYTRGQISKWVKKCHDLYLEGYQIIMLIPSYTDTKYFHNYIYKIANIEFLKGRLQFKGYTRKASFPSMLVYYGVEIE